MGNCPARAGVLTPSERVAVAEPGLAQACLGAAFGTRGPSLLRGVIFTPCPSKGRSDTGGLARVLTSAVAVAVAWRRELTNTVEMANAILRRMCRLFLPATLVPLTGVMPCHVRHTGPVGRGWPDGSLLSLSAWEVLCGRPVQRRLPPPAYYGPGLVGISAPLASAVI